MTDVYLQKGFNDWIDEKKMIKNDRAEGQMIEVRKEATIGKYRKKMSIRRKCGEAQREEKVQDLTRSQTRRRML